MRFVVPGLLLLLGCTPAPGTVASSDAGSSDGGSSGKLSSCRECVSTTDCSNQEVCVQLSPTSVCTAPCLSDSDCASQDHCAALVTAEGKHVSTCIARDNTCGAMQQGMGGQDGGTVDQGSDAGSGSADAGSTWSCSAYIAPQTSSTCMCKAGKTCTANGCYGGKYCNTNANPPYCAALPQECGGPPKLTDALSVGGPVTASIDKKTGGTMDRLLFAVVGDTRPSTVDDASNYPTTIINGIYAKLATLSPKPAFVIATGDYAFASPSRGTAVPQYNLYLQALQQFSVPFWPVMGNHECDGATTSNCTSSSGSANIGDWISTMLTPNTGETKPYYVRNVSATDGSWTAKFIFLAPNSWNSTQASFLQTQLAKSTTYTFVIRHEPSQADSAPGSTQAPGTSQIDSICQGKNITLMIEGHSHTWFYYDYTDSTDATEAFPKEVIVGNGGAPMTTMHPFGYTIITSRPADKAIVGSNYDYTTGMEQFSFAVTPDGHVVP